MDYPFWNVGIGYGVLMGVIAVVHVFLSHFAIGGGLYLVVAETSARRANDAARLEYLRKLTKFFVLATLVLGALTGVGIWFIIGLLNPAATEALIHNFVWGWAIEWTFFAVEICAAIVYYYGWKGMAARDHHIVGWIYFAAAWLSLFVINGIIGFMLTPGRWLESGSFWDGFFNPTFWPALVFRSGICILLAGIYAMLVASRIDGSALRARVVRYNTLWSLVGLAVMVPSALWYWKSVPADITATAFERMPFPIASMYSAMGFAVVLALVIIVFGMLMPKRLHAAVAVVLMALGLGLFGNFEWLRESIRKPYAIHGYMYGNGLEVARADAYRRDGYLSHMAFRSGDDGADLFRRACRSCHTIAGYQPLAPAFDGTDPDYITAIVRATDALRGNMPPFMGAPGEAAAIGAHIWKHVDQRSLADIHGLSGVELGRKVFEVRCGRCHEFGGYQDNYESLVGLDPSDYEDILDAGGDYGEGMPDFTGSDEERAALIAYLQSLQGGETP